MKITATPTAIPAISKTLAPSPHTFFHFPPNYNAPFLAHPPQIRCPSLIATCSFPDHFTSTTTTTPDVDSPDPSLAVKRKAADFGSGLKGTSIFLVGMKSSMKTRIGKLLAEALQYYYFDSDDLIEEAAGGKSAAKAFREADEKGYQESETEALKQLSAMGRLVVCAGDGAVQSATNLAFLRHGIMLWIDTPLDIIAREMIEDQSQFTGSEIATSSEEVLTELLATYEELRGGYATADATVSVLKVASKLGYEELDSVTSEDMALEVLKEMEKMTRVKKMMEEAGIPF